MYAKQTQTDIVVQPKDDDEDDETEIPAESTRPSHGGTSANQQNKDDTEHHEKVVGLSTRMS